MKSKETDYSDSIEDKKNKEKDKKKSKPIVRAANTGMLLTMIIVLIWVGISTYKGKNIRAREIGFDSKNTVNDKNPIRNYDSEYLSLDNATLQSRDNTERNQPLENTVIEINTDKKDKIENSEEQNARIIGKTQDGKQSISKQFSSPVKKGVLSPIIDNGNRVVAVSVECKPQTEILSIYSGTVTEVEKSKEDFKITTDHGDGYFSIITGRGKARVRKGKNIKQGAVIAISDDSVNSTATISLKYNQTILNPILFF